ncbi:sugar phosphate isomerase/epimerase family protein [Bacillus sp. FJAT-45037]|uniref:sugar phosphate isomerase/epimerase family protein n=1 Tax=Bacillus sp. FJAT-45037 TaxID=2011007 RepID=UPI000C23E6DC|nr:sugar phosphate isomerase/epimerase [Bacillus sp. FJAT-45037]
MKVAVQLYTLRDECEKDFVGTLEKIAALGYDGVEFAGHWGGFKANELRELLDSIGLEASGSHVSVEMLRDNLEEILQYQQVIGSKHVICPYLEEERRRNLEDYSKLVPFFNKVGERCKQLNIAFSYHNHDFELEVFDTVKPLNHLLDETNAAYVNAEFDIYWLTKANELPSEWIKRYHGRTPLLHLKDMTVDDEKEFAELGTGGVDIKAAIEAGAESGVEWLIVEQDQCKGSPFDSIELSINYLKGILN